MGSAVKGASVYISSKIAYYTIAYALQGQMRMLQSGVITVLYLRDVSFPDEEVGFVNWTRDDAVWRVCHELLVFKHESALCVGRHDVLLFSPVEVWLCSELLVVHLVHILTHMQTQGAQRGERKTKISSEIHELEFLEDMLYDY